ncbi:MAG: hypothetical protein LC796_13170 [Acidobacteria bacterium]|nr:hypothetical protein [Acidobacteriota bacterium]MCA1609330.1 hypothetical protein [Acidobacteriota bacterium]
MSLLPPFAGLPHAAVEGQDRTGGVGGGDASRLPGRGAVEGRQHEGTLPGASKGDASINATVDDRESDRCGGAVFHDNRARFDRTA